MWEVLVGIVREVFGGSKIVLTDKFWEVIEIAMRAMKTPQWWGTQMERAFQHTHFT